MAGINGITDEILLEARKQAEDIIAGAKVSADAVREKARADSLVLRENRAGEAGRQADILRSRARSQSSLLRRQALLSAKQEIIESVIEKAYDRLSGLDDDAYFDILGRLLKKAVRPEAGELCLSAGDLERLPADFAAAAAAMAREAGGSLTVSTEAAPIDNGFILKYGGIEENCSLRALFSSMKDQLQDKVNAALW